MTMSGAEVVLTGATGFVGGRLLERLVAEGARVRVLARAPARVAAHDAVRAFACDLEQSAIDTRAFDGATHVLHLAAHIPKDMRAADDAEVCLRVNALGTLALLRAAADAKVGHFVVFSSANAYAPQTRAVREDDPLYPSDRATYYLASKACGELYVDHARKAHGLATAILRVSAVYGPGMAAASSIASFATRLQKGERISIHEGGRFSSDLVHVDDVVEAAILASTLRAGGPFNVGSGVGTSTLTLAETLAELIGADRALIDVLPATSEGPLGFSPLDLTRSREALGYAPRSVREGLATLLTRGATP